MRIKLLATALLVASFASPVAAAPSVQVAGGKTSVTFSEDFVAWR